MYKHFFKRLIDIMLSLLLLIGLSLILIFIVFAIKIDSKGPVIFKQERIGKDGKVFKIYKFRSMYVGAENKGSGVYSGKNDTRVTKVGRILRATSLDHPWLYDEYTETQRRMFEMRPGVTGWAQIHGRKEVEWHKRIELNIWYIDHVSLWLDLKIFFMTIGKVFTNVNNENIGETVKTETQIEKEVAMTESLPDETENMDEKNSEYLH